MALAIAACLCGAADVAAGAAIVAIAGAVDAAARGGAVTGRGRRADGRLSNGCCGRRYGRFDDGGDLGGDARGERSARRAHNNSGRDAGGDGRSVGHDLGHWRLDAGAGRLDDARLLLQNGSPRRRIDVAALRKSWRGVADCCGCLKMFRQNYTNLWPF